MKRKLGFMHSIQKYYEPAVKPERVYTENCICENRRGMKAGAREESSLSLGHREYGGTGRRNQYNR